MAPLRNVPFGTTTTPPPEAAHLSMADWMALVLTVAASATAPKSEMTKRFGASPPVWAAREIASATTANMGMVLRMGLPSGGYHSGQLQATEAVLNSGIQFPHARDSCLSFSLVLGNGGCRRSSGGSALGEWGARLGRQDCQGSRRTAEPGAWIPEGYERSQPVAHGLSAAD